MAYANTDFTRGRTFGTTTYALLAVAVFVTLGLAGTIGSLNGTEKMPIEKFDGFHMQNVVRAGK